MNYLFHNFLIPLINSTCEILIKDILEGHLTDVFSVVCVLLLQENDDDIDGAISEVNKYHCDDETTLGVCLCECVCVYASVYASVCLCLCPCVSVCLCVHVCLYLNIYILLNWIKKEFVHLFSERWSTLVCFKSFTFNCG